MVLDFLFKRGKRKKTDRDPERYKKEREQVSSADAKGRLKVAKSRKTHPEILYYLTADEDVEVRRAVAKNKGTPIQASKVIAADRDVDVRLNLAHRLVSLLPELSDDKQSQLYAFAVNALGELALDEMLKVRLALSTALKDHAHAPPSVVSTLARDVERAVSEPILRFCVAVPDDVLLDILKAHPDSWAVEAIAARKKINDGVARGIADTGHAKGGKELIENDGARISLETLANLVQRAKLLPEWHKPLAVRKNLPADMAKMLVEFVDESVRGLLLKRRDFDQATKDEIADVVKRRLDFANEHARAEETPAARALRLNSEGRLDEGAVSDGLSWRDYDFVKCAIAILARTDLNTVNHIISLQSPKAIVALMWRTKLSMRLALQVQKEMAKIPPKELLYPRGGSDYPMSVEDIRWQLDFHGIGGA